MHQKPIPIESSSGVATISSNQDEIKRLANLIESKSGLVGSGIGVDRLTNELSKIIINNKRKGSSRRKYIF
jgi:hypothetical protein